MAQVSVVLQLDASGVVSVQKAELVVEVTEVETKPKKDAPSFLESVTNFFSGGAKADQDSEGSDDGHDEHSGDAGHDSSEGEGSSGSSKDDTPTDGATGAEGSGAGTDQGDAADTAAATATVMETTEKVVTKRLRLRTSWSAPAFERLSAAQRAAALERTAKLDKQERLRIAHSEAFNGLETLLYKTAETLDNGKATTYASAAEIQDLTAAVAEAKAWFDEVADTAETHEYNEHAHQINVYLDKIRAREVEERERPEAVAYLRAAIERTRKAALNATALLKPDDDNPWHTQEEIDKVCMRAGMWAGGGERGGGAHTGHVSGRRFMEHHAKGADTRLPPFFASPARAQPP